MRLKTLATHPVWREPRTVFGVWMLTGVIFAIVKLLIGKYNNYKIFEGVYWHAIEGLTLYGDHFRNIMIQIIMESYLVLS